MYFENLFFCHFTQKPIGVVFCFKTFGCARKIFRTQPNIMETMHGHRDVNTGVSGLPKSVQVAIGAGGFHLRLGAEECLGLVAGLQMVAHGALVGFEFNPLYEMFGQHGVLCAAHAYQHAFGGADQEGHVLLVRSIGCVLREEGHRFAAAHQRAAGGVHHFHHIAADGALVDFVVLCHGSKCFVVNLYGKSTHFGRGVPQSYDYFCVFSPLYHFNRGRRPPLRQQLSAQVAAIIPELFFTIPKQFFICCLIFFIFC